MSTRGRAGEPVPGRKEGEESKEVEEVEERKRWWNRGVMIMVMITPMIFSSFLFGRRDLTLCILEENGWKGNRSASK